MNASNLTDELGPAVIAHVSAVEMQLRENILRIKGEASGHGMLHSSRTVMYVFEAAKSVFEQQARIWFDDVLNLTVSFLGGDALSRIEDIQELYLAGVDAINKQLYGMACGSLHVTQPAFQDQIETGYRDRVRVVADSYVARLKMEIPGKVRSLSPLTHAVFHGAVGSAVFGNHNTVSSVQNVGNGGDVAVKLLELVSLLRAAVEGDQCLKDDERANRLRSLDVLQAEAEQPVPNKYTVGGLLSGVSTWAQGMAAAPGAGGAISELLGSLLG